MGVSARREYGGLAAPRAVNARRRVPRSAPSGGEHSGADAPWFDVILLPLIGALAPIVLACAWAGRRLAARIPLRVFKSLIIATTIVTTVPLLVQAWESVRSL